MQDFSACKVPAIAGAEPKLIALAWRFFTKQTVRIMKLTAIFLLAAALQVSAKGIAQEKITISVNNAPLEQVFNLIEKQSGFHFVFWDESIASKKVSVEVKNASLKEALDRCLKGLKLSYNIVGKSVVVNPAENSSVDLAGKDQIGLVIDVKGRVVNESGEPLIGATIAVEGTNKSTVSVNNGEFTLSSVEDNAVIVITYIGYQQQRLSLNGKSIINATLSLKISSLDEMQIIAYGTTTKRLNTGNVSSVKSTDIERQPVANPLAALQGRVAGLIITQTNGVPGSAFKVQLRGQSSIGLTLGSLPPNDPLFIIDGVPFAANNLDIHTVVTAAGTLSPLNSINPMDIESIEVLKDADATAIYGSRGANGVVIITTKKGASGGLKIGANFYSGWSKPSRSSNWLNTDQYVQVRKEALANDGQPMNATTAPDLVLYDTTRYTDFKKLLLGGTAHTTDAEVSLSGGSANTLFLVSGSYHRQGTLYPGNFNDTRGSFHANLNQTSRDKRFILSLTSMYSVDQNNLLSQDLTSYLKTVPNAPQIYDEFGNLNWYENGYYFDNPFAYTLQKSDSRTENLIGNLQMGYKLFSFLTLKANLGYNTMTTTGTQLSPLASYNPVYAIPGNASFGSNTFRGWIIEPQLEYLKQMGRGKLNVLIGSTWQEQKAKSNSIYADGYTSDALLGSVNGAATLTVKDNNSQYNYEAIFGRINYNWQERYILNLTGRRDGSSRFGPGNRFGNFGAVGAAWLFTNEAWMKQVNKFLSFGKIRVSYGTTGNDQIGDYKYLDSWTTLSNQYNGSPGLKPTQLFDSTFKWEINKKTEAGIELGFLNDRILLSTSYYQNRSSNQLIAYKVPAQVGFGVIAAKNFPAVVENKGMEIVLQTKNIKSKNFSWNTSFNITFPKNKLVAFPDLENSSYASTLVVGKSLSQVKMFHYTGVDPSTGLFTFWDQNKDGNITYPDDAVALSNRDPKFYGGLQNTFSYKGIELDAFFQFVKQEGNNYLYSIYSTNYGPGFRYNQPAETLNHWRAPGDQAELQKVTGKTGTPASTAINNFLSSDGIFTDASFIRLKNISLSYNLPVTWIKKLRLQSSRIYLQAQNLLTITSYKNGDPEIQNLYQHPPMKTLTAGIQLSL